MTIKIPDNYMGKPIKGSLERVLANAPVIIDPTPAIQPMRNPTPANINDPQNYIILPGQSYGNYSYPDLLVAMDRTHNNKNWNDCHTALDQENAFMLNPRQFVDFLNVLRSGNAYDGRGSPADSQKVESMLDEILTVRSLWRSEWLDAKFESRGGTLGIGSKMYIKSGHSQTIISNTTLKSVDEPLTDYLKSDKTPGIDLDSWLSNANEHGLPKANISDGSLYYWSPRNGKVVGFYAYSGGADLGCGRGPSSSYSSLGVRAARPKI